ncbi:hypothetical protein K2X33_09480 [bacterium]|nr:hypothetical protein [bacterium]
MYSKAFILFSCLTLSAESFAVTLTDGAKRLVDKELEKFSETIDGGVKASDTIKAQLDEMKANVLKAMELQDQIDGLRAQAQQLRDQQQQPQMPFMPMNNGGKNGPQSPNSGNTAGGQTPSGNDMGKTDMQAAVVPDAPQEVNPQGATPTERQSLNAGDMPTAQMPDMSGLFGGGNPNSVANVAARGVQNMEKTPVGNIAANAAATGAQNATLPSSGSPMMGNGMGGGMMNNGASGAGGAGPEISRNEEGGDGAGVRVTTAEMGTASGGGDSSAGGGEGGGIGGSNEIADIRAQRSPASYQPGKNSLVAAGVRPGPFALTVGALCTTESGKASIAACNTGHHDPIVMALSDAELKRLLRSPVTRGIASEARPALESTASWAPAEGALGNTDLLGALRPTL